MKTSEYIMLFAKLEQAREQISELNSELEAIRSRYDESTARYYENPEEFSDELAKALQFHEEKLKIRRKIKALKSKEDKISETIKQMKMQMDEEFFKNEFWKIKHIAFGMMDMNI